MATVGVGSIVESKCGKCNDVTGHVVMAMVGDSIVKVECRACQSVHKYRAPDLPASSRGGTTVKRGRNGVPHEAGRPASTASPARSQPRSASARARQNAAEEQLSNWRKVAARGVGAFTKTYSPSEQFEVEDLVSHPVFGLGEVQALFPPDKMDVLFEDGIKRLLCNK